MASLQDSIKNVRNLLDSSENRELASAYEYMCRRVETLIAEGDIPQAVSSAEHLLRDVYKDAKDGYLLLIPELMKIVLNE